MASALALEKSECVAEAPEPASEKGNNFVKGSKWSPDGSVVLASHDDSILRLYKVSEEDGKEKGHVAPQPSILKPYAEAQEGGPVSDFAFFPGFTWECPASCCFITSSQDHPIHLRDAVEGTLRNTYRPFNTADEVCHANSLCFSSDGSKIIAGFPLYLRVFDLQRPGRQIQDWCLGTRKGKGQKGIIGALAAAPLHPGTYAAGSYNRSICLYSEKTKGKAIARFADSEQDYAMGGVTQLAWCGEWLLISGHRRDQWMRAWDIRMSGGSDHRVEDQNMQPKALLHRFPRSVKTHQRFSFGIQGDLLTTGDDSGSVTIYSLTSLQEVGRLSGAHRRPCIAAELRPPGSDTDSSMLLSSSGSREFPNYDVESPEPDRLPKLAEPELASPSKKRQRSSGVLRRPNFDLDNSLRVWKLEWSNKGSNSDDPL
eukprot:TRINITY_DN27711_c0_g1_i2.p1 TRINITY_DN27711_c0_g1~~TRINITY_DN27711_c0_g1_i2.p1  ORF type:complete len:427 (-),score=41.82 TRINITY_DN27711_c0_g1_i2:51-1331(-)